MSTIQILDKTFELMIDYSTLEKRINELVEYIEIEYKSKFLVLLPILSGAFNFSALVQAKLSIPYQIDFTKLSSYGLEMKSSGAVKVLLEPQLNLKGKNILILEDIIETGTTTDFLYNFLTQKNPESIFIASLLFKQACFKGEVKPDWVGFSIPEAFVVGFGLDYAEEGRYLKSIYQLKS